VERLTKLDAARRQVDEAIKMFFDKRDTIATHTVASAASQVLADFGKARGVPGWTRNKDIIKPEHWKKFRGAMTRFEQFFKHADQDPDGICDFHPEITPLFLAEAVEMLRLLTGKFTWPGYNFMVWFYIKYPELIVDGDLKKEITSRASSINFDVNDFALMSDLIRIGYVLLPDELRNTLM
jgi:hypothetical protein